MDFLLDIFKSILCLWLLPGDTLSARFRVRFGYSYYRYYYRYYYSYYYYSSGTGTLAGAIAGTIIFLIILTIIIVLLCLRARRRAGTVVMTPNYASQPNPVPVTQPAAVVVNAQPVQPPPYPAGQYQPQVMNPAYGNPNAFVNPQYK